MTRKLNVQSWWKLHEADIPPLGGQPDQFAGGPPGTQPGSPGNPMGGQQGPNIPQNTPGGNSMDTPEDISDDPAHPDMPDQTEDDDFGIWKVKYVKESIKGDPNILIQKLLQIRDKDLSGPQFRFVEDNLDVNFLRQNANVLEASNEIRKLIKKDFDRTYPSKMLIKHITDTLQKSPLLNDVYIKLMGLGGSKGDQHRKFISSLLGAVMVGTGAQNPDLVFEEQDYSIRISTRCNSRWGDVNIGRWYLHEDDPERYLKHVEMEKLEGGSPEERDVLRRRVIVESISATFLERAFVINVVLPDGTVQHLGWDVGNSLKTAFLAGKLVVRTGDNDNREAFIDEEGSIIKIPHMAIYYVKESEGMDHRGKTNTEEIEFINYHDGVLYLSAQLDLIKEAAVSLDGMTFKETLWQGNPSDIPKLMRCVPSSTDMLFRQC